MNPEESNFRLSHIYNGVIYRGGFNNMASFSPMVEFKIKTLNESNGKYLFNNVDYKCGWFTVKTNPETGSHKLTGPLKLDLKKINDSDAKRVIDDLKFEQFNGEMIEGINNDKQNLIDEHNIPKWMLTTLLSNIYFKPN